MTICRLYKINPTCPHCGEEHEYWTIRLTDEEQQALDKHTAQHAGEHPIVSLMSPPGLAVTRKVKCGMLKYIYSQNIFLTTIYTVVYTIYRRGGALP